MSKSRNIVVGIIIGLLILAFALWGSEDAFNPQTDNRILAVGEESVNVNEFRRDYNNLIRANTERFGRPLTVGETNNLANLLVAELLRKNILLTDAKELGIGYNARTAREELEKIPMFQDPMEAKFSYEQAQVVLARQGLSTEDFAEQMITDNQIEQVAPAINKGILPPEEFAEIAFDYKRETREASVLTLTAAAVEEAPEPTEEQLRSFIDDQVNERGNTKFLWPEYRRITMIRMEPTDFRFMDETTLLDIDPEKAKLSYNNIFITEEEIDQQYELKISAENLVTPATRSLIVYQAENETTANTIVEKINDGLTEEEITSLLGLSAPEYYTNVEQYEIFDADVAEAAFEMKVDDVKAVYGSLENWVTFKVTAATEEIKPEKDTVRQDVLATILEQKTLDVIYDKMDEVQLEIYENGRTIEEAAQIVGVPFTTLPFVDRGGRTQDERTLLGRPGLPGIATDPEIMRFIFTSNPGTEIDIFDTAGKGSATIRVDAVLEETQKSFEESKVEAEIMWKDDYVESQLEELSLNISTRLAEGESLADIAASIEKGASIEQVTLMRNSRPQTMGPIIFSGLIEGVEGDPVIGSGALVQTRQIATLDKIVANTTPIPDSERATEMDRITAEIAQDIETAYQQAVIAQHPYTTNEEALRRVLGLDEAEQ